MSIDLKLTKSCIAAALRECRFDIAADIVLTSAETIARAVLADHAAKAEPAAGDVADIDRKAIENLCRDTGNGRCGWGVSAQRIMSILTARVESATAHLRKLNDQWAADAHKLQRVLKDEIGSDGSVYGSVFDEAASVMRHLKQQLAERDAKAEPAGDVTERFIERVEGRCGGKPCLRGHRLWLSHLLANVSSEDSLDDYADNFALSKELVRGAFNEICNELDALTQWPPLSETEIARQFAERDAEIERLRGEIETTSEVSGNRACEIVKLKAALAEARKPVEFNREETAKSVSWLLKLYSADTVAQIVGYIGSKLSDERAARLAAEFAAKSMEEVAKELTAELALWKPMTPEEAERAIAECEAAPISDDEVEAIVAKVTDPTYRPTEPEHVQLAAKIRQLTAERDAEKADASEFRAALNAVSLGMKWSGDGYEWNPTHGDYREEVLATIARAAKAYQAELAAANQRAAEAEAIIKSQSTQIGMLVKDASAALSPTTERLRGRMEERERIVRWLQIKASHPLNGHAARNTLNDAADAISRCPETPKGEE